ncbi:MobP2 family relaxase [Leuconostoc pseudomesenteroides]|uniref:MobP2 family relaxase n=1 Tax=Leuconostoc pseudomesenteroides TaxID=33968 RepID=UPI0039EB94AB
MVKTGKKATFKMGEAKTASVINPTKFVTAKSANAAGLHYENLVNYATAKQKTDQTNDAPVTDFPELKNQLNYIGYATRASAVTETFPTFNSDKLNMDNHDISVLKQQLVMAQNNGNNLYEMAFSLRGDFLKDHSLYDPVTKIIDQARLKKAEQNIVDKLMNRGFSLPLAENKNDLVWFGVIHQDTDHLNMHLWAAKISPETRSEMLVHGGQYDGQPKGVIKFKTISAVQRQFINQLLTQPEIQQRQDVIKQVTHLERKLAAKVSSHALTTDKFEKDIQNIYRNLPRSVSGQWQVGNANMLALNPKSKMFHAHTAVNTLIDRLTTNTFSVEYDDFTKKIAEKDYLDEYDKGMLHDKKKSWGYGREAQFRKDVANKIYRRLNEWSKTSSDGETQLPRINELKDLVGHNSKIISTKKGTIGQQKKIIPNDLRLTAQHQVPMLPKAINQAAKIIKNDIRVDSRAQRSMRRATEQQEYEKAVSEAQSQHI